MSKVAVILSEPPLISKALAKDVGLHHIAALGKQDGTLIAVSWWRKDAK